MPYLSHSRTIRRTSRRFSTYALPIPLAYHASDQSEVFYLCLTYSTRVPYVGPVAGFLPMPYLFHSCTMRRTSHRFSTYALPIPLAYHASDQSQVFYLCPTYPTRVPYVGPVGGFLPMPYLFHSRTIRRTSRRFSGRNKRSGNSDKLSSSTSNGVKFTFRGSSFCRISNTHFVHIIHYKINVHIWCSIHLLHDIKLTSVFHTFLRREKDTIGIPYLLYDMKIKLVCHTLVKDIKIKLVFHIFVT